MTTDLEANVLRKSSAVLAAATMIGSSAVAVAAQVVFGAGTASASCPPDTDYYWKKTTVSYKTIGIAKGEYNSGKSTVPFDYTEKTETTASTSVSAGASFSVSVGIASIGTDLKVTVEKTFTKGTSVTARLYIPAHEGGTLQPKAQFTKFTYYRSMTTPQCGSKTTNLGSLTGITKAPYFASCVGSNSCSPKP